MEKQRFSDWTKLGCAVIFALFSAGYIRIVINGTNQKIDKGLEATNKRIDETKEEIRSVERRLEKRIDLMQQTILDRLDLSGRLSLLEQPKK